MAGVDCEDCQKHVYNLETGERESYQTSAGKMPLLRTDPPPCHSCPKGSPRRGAELKLDPCNLAAIELFKANAATKGNLRLHPKIAQCATYARVMRLIEWTYGEAEVARMELVRQHEWTKEPQ